MTKNSHPALYETPQVRARVPLEPDGAILSTSVVEFIQAVETTGHDVENYDFSEPQFNHTWE